jgi:hypothetical protein
MVAIIMFRILWRVWEIINKRCTICGKSCENIRMISSKGLWKEWCDNCMSLQNNDKCHRCL